MQAYAITLLRLSLGTLALAHGLLKVFVFTVPGTVGYFESLGLPGFLAYPTILAEVGGGLLLILGIYTRWISLALVPVLLGATWVHSGNGWMFSNEGGGWEFPVFWTLALLVQAGLGGGRLVPSRRLA
ncbi:DoxX family protein [Halomonas elongata]|uniref:DoxX domain protein n=1 Tax=Halomonas elongata (strain ATCC 33173 / DSM 2581 / NBRC 15536 / NCIMB 2198 / 1H9) TaxID=768066 RepID=E1VBM4_HALED|nr:DoxX family protein [Halomonas elongata]MBW5800162.1 DoxX family protein [Halomonas elongata]MDL4862705.1 DoxX family protein [Halomonas elongata]RAW06687.1 DoxX family protein [Halomonas elongata]WBF17949.1 DoxX family protein [Halomonas elongata]WPU46796.1 DoxX family protein [Halomonas elongata DSM 2581]